MVLPWPLPGIGWLGTKFFLISYLLGTATAFLRRRCLTGFILRGKILASNQPHPSNLTNDPLILHHE